MIFVRIFLILSLCLLGFITQVRLGLANPEYPPFHIHNSWVGGGVTLTSCLGGRLAITNDIHKDTVDISVNGAGGNCSVVAVNYGGRIITREPLEYHRVENFYSGDWHRVPILWINNSRRDFQIVIHSRDNMHGDIINVTYDPPYP